MEFRQLATLSQKIVPFFRPHQADELVPTVDWFNHRFGEPQRSGPLTMLPVFGPERNGHHYAAPYSGLKLSKVAGYGNVELLNPASNGVVIVPLHIGYIQDQAQNHALCRSAFLAGGQKLMFKDACCVQESQGGYLKGQEQWFFILPLPLRYPALMLRGQEGYSKLWDDITKLNVDFGYPQRGHLEQILTRQRAYLTQYQSRLELLSGQTGALFFLNDKLVGVEITPNATYFAELWTALICFCYGPLAMWHEQRAETAQPLEPFAATRLSELKAELQQRRHEAQAAIQQTLERTPLEQFEWQEEEQFLSLRLSTVDGLNFAGQLVTDEDALVYASIFAKPNWLDMGVAV